MGIWLLKLSRFSTKLLDPSITSPMIKDLWHHPIQKTYEEKDIIVLHSFFLLSSIFLYTPLSVVTLFSWSFKSVIWIYLYLFLLILLFCMFKLLFKFLCTNRKSPFDSVWYKYFGHRSRGRNKLFIKVSTPIKISLSSYYT